MHRRARPLPSTVSCARSAARGPKPAPANMHPPTCGIQAYQCQGVSMADSPRHNERLTLGTRQQSAALASCMRPAFARRASQLNGSPHPPGRSIAGIVLVMFVKSSMPWASALPHTLSSLATLTKPRVPLAPLRSLQHRSVPKFTLSVVKAGHPFLDGFGHAAGRRRRAAAARLAWFWPSSVRT